MVDAVNAGGAARYASVYAPHAVITIYGTGKLEGRDSIERKASIGPVTIPEEEDIAAEESPRPRRSGAALTEGARTVG